MRPISHRSAPFPPEGRADISRYDRPFQARNRLLALYAVLFSALLALVPGLTPAARADTPLKPAQKPDTPSGQPVPRWAMLRKPTVYARTGPSKDNPVAWTYTAQSLPVQIISETRDWRLVCDPDGGVAWVSKTMLQSQKTVLSPAQATLEMRASPKADAQVKAILKPRALAGLNGCKKGWCKLSAGGVTGWVPQNGLWGTQQAAVCRRPGLFETARE